MNPSIFPSSRLRILCADDEEIIREFLCMLLTSAGHECESVGNGASALEKLQSEPGKYDLVITDLSMPGMGGLALIRHLRDIGFPGGIVIFSGSLDIIDRQALAAIQVDGTLQKPAHAAEILRLVEETCSRFEKKPLK